MRKLGAARTAALAHARLGERSLAGEWIHVHPDVFDPAVMPAVDSPEPDGLSTEERPAPIAAGARPPAHDLRPAARPAGGGREPLVGLLEQVLVPAPC